jgi:polysaccharide export outer membrane protein
VTLKFTKHDIKNIFIILQLIAGPLFLTSCKSRENASYFSNLDSIRFVQINKAVFVEPTIQSDDILSINVQTLGQNAFLPPNQSSSRTSDGSTTVGVAVGGFLVNKEGNVELPMLGIVKLSGLTITKAVEVVRTAAAKYYKDPTVQVRFANFKITILGDVERPASFTVPNEKTSILDAISMAGDLKITGKRSNILLMRDNGDKKDVVRLNLNSSDIVASPYFYLKQNDVLYVEPNKTKVAAANGRGTQLVTIAISIATLIITVVTRF